MSDMCTDNRFELIEKFKKELIESTNIETSPEEMNVLDNILFRFWQIGWLDSIDRMPLVKESAKTLMHSVGDSVVAKALRNAGRFIQNAIDGEAHEFEKIPSAEPELCEDAVSRQRLLSDLKELIAAWKKYPVMAEQIKGVETAIGYVKVIPSVKPYSKELSSTHKALDTISRRAAIVQLSHNKTGDDDCDVVIQNDIETIKALPSEEVSADIIHLQKEQAYMQGYEDGRKSRKGKWIYKDDLKQYFCSECGYPSLTHDDVYIYSMDLPNFCEDCGADMMGEEDE